MDMDFKWIMIWVAIVLFSIGVFAGIKNYQQNQCKTSLVWEGRTADEIVKICKK